MSTLGVARRRPSKNCLGGPRATLAIPNRSGTQEASLSARSGETGDTTALDHPKPRAASPLPVLETGFGTGDLAALEAAASMATTCGMIDDNVNRPHLVWSCPRRGGSGYIEAQDA